MTIFVSIASYRDPELMPTIRSLYDNADNPRDIHLGVVSQNVRGRHPNFKGWDNTKCVEINALDARGAGYARKIAMELYDGEDFFLQIDSHMRFAKGWDTKLIDMYNWCVSDAGTDKIILSQFPASYIVGSDGKDYYLEDDQYWAEPSTTKVGLNSDGSWGGKRVKMPDKSHPQKSLTILAGYLFAKGSIAHEVPYDDRISFMGEEICFALRAYTRGWEIYAPNEMLVWHYYERRGERKVWNDGARDKSWMQVEGESMAVQKAVLTAQEHGTYGIDDYDRYFEFQDNVEIDFEVFYASGELQRRNNLGVMIEELDFFSPIRSGYCVNELHDECKINGCYCGCHDKEN